MGELIFVGLGLAGIGDLSLKALEALRECDVVFAEFYTSKATGFDQAELESITGKRMKVLSREEVETGNEVIEATRTGKVCFVTAGDPMAATTHVDLRIRAQESGIATRLVHGISIFTACASALGLQPYKFGRTVTLPFSEPGYSPTSPYENILENKARNLHTLILLDIKEEEGRYMTASEGVRWLLDAERRTGKGLIGDKTLICAAARIGSPSEKVIAAYPPDLISADLGPPLHAFVLPGRLHFMEARSLVTFAAAPQQILENED